MHCIEHVAPPARHLSAEPKTPINICSLFFNFAAKYSKDFYYNTNYSPPPKKKKNYLRVLAKQQSTFGFP